MLDSLKYQFFEIFGHQPQDFFFAPGRVNLIGEHIDYNGGLVMPCAINFGTYLITAPNHKGVFRFRSINFDETLDIPLKDEYRKQSNDWYNYPLGVINYLLEQKKSLEGLDLLYYGDLPIGAGLSSSASIEIVTAFALNKILKCGLSKLELVLLAKKVENEFIGLNSGIMDQFAVTFGEKSKALMLNCETLDYEAVDSNLGDHILAIINTNKSRELAESKYNERVDECQTALNLLKQELNLENLCEIDTLTFNKYEHVIENSTIRNRARHVVEENQRVKLAAAALASNRLEEFGKLMYQSHASLKELYEVSGHELDTIVEFCLSYPGVVGARMTGAGFGGCAIALVKKESFEDFSNKITSFYTAHIGYAPSVYASKIGDGVLSLTI